MKSQRSPGEEFDNENLPRGAVQRASELRPPREGRRRGYQDLEVVRYVGVAAFSEDPVLRDPRLVLGELLEHEVSALLFGPIYAKETDVGLVAEPDMLGELRWELQKKKSRRAGNFVAAYLGYVLSGYTRVYSWHAHVKSDTEFWRLCGFPECPNFRTLDLRFAELEEYWRIFAAVTRFMVRTASTHLPDLCDVVFGDGRAFVSGSRLERVTEKTAGRKRSKKNAKDELQRQFLESAPAKQIDKLRADELARMERTGEEQQVEHVRGERRTVRHGGKEWEIRLHHTESGDWKSRDTTCSLRVYGEKVWFGGLVYYLTGAIPALPVEAVTNGADVQEYDFMPDAMSGLRASRGGTSPYLWATDSMGSNDPVAAFLTAHQCSLVAPRRGRENKRIRDGWRKDLVDEDGCPRCQFCRGEGYYDVPGLGLVFVNDEPYITYRCRFPLFPSCREEQRIACREHPLLLLGLSRLTESYWTTRYMRNPSEGTNAQQQQRHGEAAKHSFNALGRPAVPAQRLRIWAGMLIDWFRASLRCGWLDPVGLQVIRFEPVREVVSGSLDGLTRELQADGFGSCTFPTVTSGNGFASSWRIPARREGRLRGSGPASSSRPTASATTERRRSASDADCRATTRRVGQGGRGRSCPPVLEGRTRPMGGREGRLEHRPSSLA
jgi:hypothetical protein